MVDKRNEGRTREGGKGEKHNSTPNRVNRLTRSNHEHFLLGPRAEVKGLFRI